MVNKLEQDHPIIAILTDKAKVGIESRKPHDVAKRLPEIREKGLSSEKVKDYQNSFIFLKRYMMITDWIKTKKEFKTNPTLYKQFMPDCDIAKVKLALKSVEEKLISSLLSTNDTKQSVSSLNKRSSIDKNQSKNSTIDIVLNLPETPTDDPINNSERDDFISCLKLYKMLSTPRFLIIDVRSADDYTKSRIKTKRIVNIPAKEINYGILATKFEVYLREQSPTELSLYLNRSRRFVDTIILIDWYTSRGPLDSTKALATLKTILKEWDPGTDVADIVVLDGGYAEWLNVYPVMAINPSVTLPTENITDDIIRKPVDYPDYLDDWRKPEAEVRKANYPSNLLNSKTTTNPYDYMDNADDEMNGTFERLSQEVEKMDFRESTPPKITPKPPTIDRSSKPAISASDPNTKIFLNYLNQLNDIGNWQEKYERQLLKLISDQYSKFDNDDYDADDFETQKHAVELSLQTALNQKLITKQELDKLEKIGIEWNKADEAEKNKLELRLGDVKHRITSISMDRKSQQQNFDAIVKSRLTPKQNNNLIYKEPLKTDGPSTNSGLKRSLSSPNLAQMKVPQVDRSSKPFILNKNRETNNNILPITSRDPSKRMDAVFRDGHPGITGLKNLGNSCYMNSILQCLSNTPLLSKYFIENSYSDNLNTAIENETRGQIAEEFAQVIKALWRGQYKSIAPRDLKNAIGQYREEFDNQDQQDSHEFLTFFLDWMHNDLKRTAKIRRDSPISAAEKEWDKALGNQTSIISQLFIGQLRSTVTCLICSCRSITYEMFNSLSISLPDPNRCTLDDCLQHFLRGQRISGWACPKCKTPRDAIKKFDFVKLAPIMVIHLNRFGGTDFGLEKKNTHVIFPINDLNLKSYLARDPDSIQTIHHTQGFRYNLYALSNHYGTMAGGHYTAFCKSATLNKWYEYNDQIVAEVGESQVKAQNRSAYLLFYSSLHCESYISI